MDNTSVTPNISKGNTTTEFSIAKIGIGAGIGIQLFTEVLSALKNKDTNVQHEAVVAAITKSVHEEQQEFSTSVGKSVTPQDIITLTNSIGSSNSYIGAILALIMAVVYIVKRAILKYFELKGQIEIAVAQIEANTAAAIRNIKPQPCTNVENPNTKDDIVFPTK